MMTNRTLISDACGAIENCVGLVDEPRCLVSNSLHWDASNHPVQLHPPPIASIYGLNKLWCKTRHVAQQQDVIVDAQGSFDGSRNFLYTLRMSSIHSALSSTSKALMFACSQAAQIVSCLSTLISMPARTSVKHPASVTKMRCRLARLAM